VIAFACVVVDDVEDDLEAGGVQQLHHPLEFPDRADRILVGRVVVVRREVAVGVIAPVVPQPLVHQVLFVHELVDGQQFDGGDPERGQIVDGCRVRQPRVRAAQVLGHLVPELAEALDVHLVDDRLVQRPARRPIPAPVERVIDDDRLRNIRPAVAIVALQVVAAERTREHGVIPFDVAGDRFRVRVHEQLRRVAALAVRWIPGAVDAIAVLLPRAHARQAAVPAEGGFFGKRHAGLAVVLVEEAQFDALGDLGENGEVGTSSVPRRAERKRFAGSNRRTAGPYARAGRKGGTRARRRGFCRASAAHRAIPPAGAHVSPRAPGYFL
jgi:hypothetical protein